MNDIPTDDEIKVELASMSEEAKAEYLAKAQELAKKDVEKVPSKMLKLAIAIIHEANRHRTAPAKKAAASGGGGRGRKKAEPAAPSINLDDFLK